MRTRDEGPHGWCWPSILDIPWFPPHGSDFFSSLVDTCFYSHFASLCFVSIKTSKNKRILNSKSYSYLTTLAYYVSCIYNIYFYTVWFFLFSSSTTGFFGCHRNLFLHLEIFSVLLRYRIVLTEVYTSGGFVRFILEMFYIPLIIETQKKIS